MLIAALCLVWTASAAPPRSLKRELRAWVKLVESEKRAELLARLPATGKVLFRAVAHPDQREPRPLTRDQVHAELEAGKANLLGLSSGLLLPRVKDLVRVRPKRWKANDSRCPEVTWIFERRGRRWVLVEVVRTLLSC